MRYLIIALLFTACTIYKAPKKKTGKLPPPTWKKVEVIENEKNKY